MTPKYFFTSLTRISDLPETSVSMKLLPQEEWEEADYVVGEVSSPPGSLSQIELANGRMVEVVEGDLVMGAFGMRYATLESVGDWREIGDDLQMSALTAASLFEGHLRAFPAGPPHLQGARHRRRGEDQDARLRTVRSGARFRTAGRAVARYLHVGR